jgi:hypothetical protein
MFENLSALVVGCLLAWLVLHLLELLGVVL